MPTVTYEFTLPEEQEDFECVTQARKMATAISQFNDYLRRKVKYEDLCDVSARSYEECREKFWQILSENCDIEGLGL